MILTTRKARADELEAIMNFYYDVIRIMADMAYQPGWVKDVYPTRDYILASIDAGEFYLGFVGQELACVMMLNNHSSDGYETVTWPTEAAPEEVFVLHALGVHPKYQGTGLSHRWVEAAIEHSRSRGGKVIRLDVLGSNLPAQRLYPKLGFQYVTTLKLYYDNTGLTDFLLYELRL